MITKLIYTGRSLYTKSRTMLGALYTESGQRYDWGFVERDLQHGDEVHIRPPTEEEAAHYDRKLDELLKQEEPD